MENKTTLLNEIRFIQALNNEIMKEMKSSIEIEAKIV